MNVRWSILRRYALMFAALVVLIAGAVFLLLRPASVSITPAREGTVRQIVQGPGNIASRIPVTVASRITGVVTALRADQGDTVKHGQLLATLDARDLVANLAAARANLALARSNYRRDLEVFRHGYIAASAMDATRTALRAAESAESAAAVALSYTQIHAPMDGQIIERDAEIGDTLVPGSPIFRMVDLHTLWSATLVDETVVGHIKVGDPAQVRLRSGTEVPGHVVRIGLQADPVTRELEVDVAPDTPFPRFANGEETEVTIETGSGKGLVVPVSALVRNGGAEGVLVARDGRAQFRAVRTGIANASKVVVLEGLRAGDPVLIQPRGIRPGERVRARRQGD